jgi:catechol 2,3-dioxygenase-like lactoylglutathione lyase family enzyme
MKRIRLSLIALLLCMPGTADENYPRPRIVGIAGVLFYSTDIAATSHFYRQLLRPPDDCSWCEPVFPRPALYMPLRIDQGLIQGLTLVTLPTPPPSNLLYEIDFATTDSLKQTKEYLIHHKIPIEQDESPRDHRLVVLDPEGHRVGFVAFKQPPRHIAAPVLTSIPLRLIHAGLIVHDRAAEDHFYKDILDFHVYWHGGMEDDETNWVDMQVPDGTDWLEYMLNVSPNASHKTLGVMNHVALGVPDIHAVEEQLIKNGWKPGEEPHIGRDGKWQLNMYDPDETRVEFMEFTPVQKPCCSDYTGPHPKP